MIQSQVGGAADWASCTPICGQLKGGGHVAFHVPTTEATGGFRPLPKYFTMEGQPSSRTGSAPFPNNPTNASSSNNIDMDPNTPAIVVSSARNTTGGAAGNLARYQAPGFIVFVFV